MTITTWIWTGTAGNAPARVTVGRAALYVDRTDGVEVTEAVHRAALAEALAAAVAEVRKLKAELDAARAAMT